MSPTPRELQLGSRMCAHRHVLPGPVASPSRSAVGTTVFHPGPVLRGWVLTSRHLCGTCGGVPGHRLSKHIWEGQRCEGLWGWGSQVIRGPDGSDPSRCLEARSQTAKLPRGGREGERGWQPCQLLLQWDSLVGFLWETPVHLQHLGG